MAFQKDNKVRVGLVPWSELPPYKVGWLPAALILR